MGNQNGSEDGGGMFLFSVEGKALNLYNFESEEEEKDIVKGIERVQVPLFENKYAQKISNIVYITGNTPYHEGLIILMKSGKFYISQVYPITLEQVGTYQDALMEISYFCSTNQYSVQNEIKEYYEPTEEFTIGDVRKFLESMPNKYSIIKENCQYFCREVIKNFPLIEIVKDNIKKNSNKKVNIKEINMDSINKKKSNDSKIFEELNKKSSKKIKIPEVKLNNKNNDDNEYFVMSGTIGGQSNNNINANSEK